MSFLPVRPALITLDAMAYLHYFISRKKKNSILANLKKMGLYKPIEAKNTIINYFKCHYRSQLFIFMLNKAESLIIDSCDCLKEIRNAGDGSGIIILHSHFLIPQAALYYFHKNGLKVAQVYHYDDNNISFIGKKVQLRLRKKLEKRLASELFPASHFIRDLLKWLRSGNILFISGDGAGYGKNFGKFIEKRILSVNRGFPADYIRICNRTNSKIFIMSMLPVGNYKYKIKLRPMPDLSGPAENAVSFYVKDLEDQIKACNYGWHFMDEDFAAKDHSAVNLK